MMTMKNNISVLFWLSCVFIFSNCGGIYSDNSNDERVYIVYMGASSVTNINNQNLLLASFLERNKDAIVHMYRNGFTGFAVKLSDTEANEVANKPGVVSVFPDPILQLHTTRSWDFLDYETSLLTDSPPRSGTESSSQGSDTIIGIFDTGIWPEAESFNDEGMGPIPSRWKGTCMKGLNFNPSTCNKKLIGARYYLNPHSTTALTARDELGHGTHVASTAVGSPIQNASYYGLASGTAKGGSPKSRIAMYKVCSGLGCPGSAIMAAFEDAISDGVDLLSLSLGATAEQGPDFATDPVAIGSFHAVQNGIVVLCSGGNDGPYLRTVVNVAPWILTVGATTIDRDLQSGLVLGNNVVIKGESINFSELEKSPVYPLVSGVSAKARTATEELARKCHPQSLDPDKIEGKIVLCVQNDTEVGMNEKSNDVKKNKGVGVAFVSDVYRLVGSNWGTFPATVISTIESMQVIEYINSTSNPVATILPTETVLDYKPAPTVAYFSARGPSYATKNILKPDIVAPGVNILAAWIANDTKEGTTPSGRKPPKFNVISGTSMACPHAAGIAATIKARYPTWSPAAIRSSIMTSAIQTNNQKNPITTHIGEVATPYDYGAGEISSTGALQPGLIYDTDPKDYIRFLCYIGYNDSAIKLVAGELPTAFSCPENSTKDMISNINYPSISISKNVGVAPVTVTRTVTNVDSDDVETTYTVSVDSPEGLEVNVVPNSLKFTANTKKLSYQVEFSSSSKNNIEGNVFGAITWSNEKHRVRSPFVVSSEEL